MTRNLIEQVASKPWYDHVFQVSSFQDLSELLRRLKGRGIYLFISKQNILDSELLIGLKWMNVNPTEVAIIRYLPCLSKFFCME